MQIQKEAVNERIRTAARLLFRQEGFGQVTMRGIAKASHMTVGNIYRYYTSKDQLFYSLMKPVVDAIEELLMQEFPQKLYHDPKLSVEFIGKMIDHFLSIHRQYSDELYILVHGCQSSELHHTVDHITYLLAKRLSEMIGCYHDETIDVDFMSQLMAKNIIENYVAILYRFESDSMKRKHMLQMTNSMTCMYLSDILDREKEA